MNDDGEIQADAARNRMLRLEDSLATANNRVRVSGGLLILSLSLATASILSSLTGGPDGWAANGGYIAALIVSAMLGVWFSFWIKERQVCRDNLAWFDLESGHGSLPR